MRRWLALSVAIVLLGTPVFAQQETLPDTRAAPVAGGQSAAPAPPAMQPADAPPPSAPLPSGPPAGDERAQDFSNAELIAGGVAVTAVVVCAIACFSNSSSTTTSTTVVHR